MVDGLLYNHRNHYPAGRADNREQHREPEALTKERRLANASTQNLRGTHAAAKFFIHHESFCSGASSDAVMASRSTSNASINDR